MKIRAGERDFALELIQKFCYARDEESYNRFYRILEASDLPSVKAYFDTHWHDIREEWVDGLNYESFTLGERTNNRLESINAKIKSVCSVNADLASFFNNFLSFLSSIRNERDHSTIMAIAKQRAVFKSSIEEQFTSFLTPYAFEKVSKQLRWEPNVSVSLSEESNDWIAVDKHCDKQHTVDSDLGVCDCLFNTTLHLPCRHVLAVRAKRGHDLFSREGVAGRWTAQYLKEYWEQRRQVDYDNTDFQVLA